MRSYSHGGARRRTPPWKWAAGAGGGEKTDLPTTF